MQTHLYVTFDTSVYRKISASDLGVLIEAERRSGIVALASFWPCIELLNHCASATDLEHGNARRALERLSQHSGYEGESGPRLRMTMDGESLLEKVLLGIEPVDRLEEHGNVADVLGRFAKMNGVVVPAELTKILSQLSSEMQSRELGFVEHMKTVAGSVAELMATVDPPLTVQDARRQLLQHLRDDQSLHLMARSMVAGLAEQHGIVLDDQDLDSRGEVALAAFPVTMHLFRSLARAALENGDMNWMKTENRNSYWDLRVSFHAARDASVGDIPALLVSNDGAMIRAADEAGCRLVLLRLDEYQDLVHHGDVGERARLIRAMPSTIDKVPHLVAPRTRPT